MPILDGLDEIPEEIRGPAITRINDALRPGEHLVVTCRSKEYRGAVQPESGLEVTLRGATAVELCSLDADAVRSYLGEDAAGPVAKARWKPVLDVLDTEAPAAQALGTPLMVGLARAIYNPRPGELAGALRNPAELCDPEPTDREAVETLLFDAFIPAAYRGDPSDRWKEPDAEKWLTFLARHLDHNVAGPNLAWWQLALAMRSPALWFRFLLSAVVGIGIAVVFVALSGGRVEVGAIAGIAGWAVFGIVFVADKMSVTKGPSRGDCRRHAP